MSHEINPCVEHRLPVVDDALVKNLAATVEDYFHSGASFYTFNKQHPLMNVSHYKSPGLELPGLHSASPPSGDDT